MRLFRFKNLLFDNCFLEVIGAYSSLNSSGGNGPVCVCKNSMRASSRDLDVSNKLHIFAAQRKLWRSAWPGRDAAGSEQSDFSVLAMFVKLEGEQCSPKVTHLSVGDFADLSVL